MLERAVQFLYRRRPGLEVRWLTREVAIGRARGREGWSAAYAAGIRAVVELNEGEGDPEAVVRDFGMRYLRFSLRGASVPSAAELHLLAAWAQDRIAGGGRVLIQGRRSRLDDGLVAVAALVREGLPAHLALLALRRVMPGRALTREQHAELVRFATAQDACRGPDVLPVTGEQIRV